MSAAILRRAFLLALVLSSCASVDEQCQFAPVWQQDQIESRGDMRIKWEVVSPEALPGYCKGRQDLAGCAWVYPGFTEIYLAHRPGFSQTCALATLGHEVAHGMGATHTE